MSWTLLRDGTQVSVTFEPPFDHDWGQLFEAILRELESGVSTVVLPDTLPNGSATANAVLEALRDQLVARGVEVRASSDPES